MFKRISIVIILLFSFSCSKDVPLIEVNNLTGNEIIALGHGGSGISSAYPMDSWESIEQCLEKGADGAEIDIQLTMDSVLVAFHGEKLEDGTNCHGLIHEKNWPEIERCQVNSLLPGNIYIMRMEDIFSRIKNPENYYFTFDCKLYTKSGNMPEYYDQYATAVIRLLDKYKMADNVLIESVHIGFLRQLQKKRSDLKLFIYPPNFERGLEIAADLDLFGISFDSRFISKEQTDQAHSMGFRIALWNVQTKHENLEAIEKNPDYIQTDKIRHLVKTLGK